MASDHSAADRIEKRALSERQALPEKYLGLSDAEMDARIAPPRERSATVSSSSGITISATR
jgi:hypothetical protein